MYVGQFLMTGTVTAILVFGLTESTLCGDGTKRVFCDVHLARLDSFPIFMGIVTFALEGVGTVLYIKNSMRNPADFEAVTLRAVPALTCAFVLFGSLGYALFGLNTVSVSEGAMGGKVLLTRLQLR